MELRTYIVEDNATIRENLIGALEELASIRPLGWAETERQATEWLAGKGAVGRVGVLTAFRESESATRLPARAQVT